MDNIILSQIPLSDIISQVRQAVREELAAIGQTSSTGSLINEPPITTKELCKFLNITPPTVIRWKQKGKIPFIQIGTAVRFNLKDVIKALEKK